MSGAGVEQTMGKPYEDGTDDPLGLADEPVPFCNHDDDGKPIVVAGETLGFVYFVGPSDEPGPVKIGFTERMPRVRMATLQIGSPVRLTLYVTIPAQAKNERAFHGAFATDRLHGEWFRASPRLQRAIRILRTQKDICYRMPGDTDEPPILRLLARVDAA